MSFQNPLFLYAFLLLLIPIAIHLFNFQKYKPLMFSNLQFLMNIQSKTKQQSQLKKLLLLLSRLLIFSSLILAFAKPVLNQDRQENFLSDNQLILYVDNSYSMGANSSEGLSMIELAKNKAKETIQQFSYNDQFMVLSNELEGSSFRFVNRDDALVAIDKIQLSHYSRSFNDIIKRINDVSKSKLKNQMIISIYSDFQTSNSIIDKSLLKPETKVLLNLLKHQNQNNLYIDSCWFEMPIIRQNQQLSLNVNVVNQSTHDFDMLPIQLIINGNEVSSSILEIKANTSQVARLNYIETTDGIKHAQVKIDDKGNFNYDDVFYLTYEIRKEISVLELFEKKNSPYIKSLFSNDSLFNFSSSNIKNVDYSSFSNYNFIILSDVMDIADGTISELKKAQSEGVVMLFIPSMDASLENLNYVSSQISDIQYSFIDTNRTQIDEISLEHYLFKNVFEKTPSTIDLPTILYRFSIQNQKNIIPLIKLMDGSILLGQSIIEGRESFYMSTPLNDKSGNLHRHALIVPSLINMAIYSKKNQNLYYIIGNQEEINIKSNMNLSDGAIKLIHHMSKVEFVPSFVVRSNVIKIFPNIEELLAGNYNIQNAENIIGGVSFNSKPEESDMSFQDEDSLNKKIDEGVENQIQIITQESNLKRTFDRILNKNNSIWSYFVFLALIFLIFEILIIRTFR